MKNKYSINKKLNNVYTAIKQQLLNIHDNETESVQEVKHYMTSFPKEVDYNIAQHGNMLTYYSDVRNMYAGAGYISISRYSDGKLWNIYLRQVGYVARELTK